MINILGTSFYKLDVRTHNPMADQSKYSEKDEQYATFLNLREDLINKSLKTPTRSLCPMSRKKTIQCSTI
jgi:hypothetical protein